MQWLSYTHISSSSHVRVTSIAAGWLGVGWPLRVVLSPSRATSRSCPASVPLCPCRTRQTGAPVPLLVTTEYVTTTLHFSVKSYN